MVKENNSFMITTSFLEKNMEENIVKESDIDGLKSNSLWIVVKSLKMNTDNRVYYNLFKVFKKSFRFLNYRKEII